MSTQRQLKVSFPPPPTCMCGCVPKVYITTYDPNGRVAPRYHMECYQCQHITPKFKSVAAASGMFRSMMTAIQLDRSTQTHKQLGVVR